MSKGYALDSIRKIILLTGITTGVYLGMRYILPMVIPFFIGGLLAALLNPLVEKIVRRTGRNRSTISMIAVIGILSVAATGLYFAARTVWHQLVALAGQADAIEGAALTFWCDCCKRFEYSLGIVISEPEQIFERAREKLRMGVQTKAVPFLLKNSFFYARSIFSLLGLLLVSVISGMLILTDYPALKKNLQKSGAGRLLSQMKRHLQQAGGTYLKAQLLILAIVSGICIAGLFLMGNHYALLAGLGIGLCDALPFVGTGVILVPCLLIGVLNGKYVLAAVYGLLYLLCSFARQMLEPRLIGNRLGFPPVFVLMSIYIGIQVYGGAGVLLGPVSAFVIWELYRTWG